MGLGGFHLPFEESMMLQSEQVDCLVIGSGFGGSVAASRLSSAGKKVVLLERGKEWKTSDEQDTFSSYRHPDGRSAWLSDETVLFEPQPIPRFTGLVERCVEDGVTVWVAAGVGGGSLVYNTVLLRPSQENFEKVFASEVSYSDFVKYFDRVYAVMQPEQIPDEVLNTHYYLSSRVFLEQAAKAGLHTEKLFIASSWDIAKQEISGEKRPSAIDGEIWYGINSGMKKSLDRNYLDIGLRTGNLEIRPLHNVTGIREDDSDGFAVHYQRIDSSGKSLEEGTITTRRLFLGAGSIGTSRLLIKAKGKGTLPKLNDFVGKFWGDNGDTFATRNVGTETNPGQGGPASVVIKHHDNPISPQTIIVYPQWDAPEGTLTSLGMSIPQDHGEFRYDDRDESVKLFWPIDSPGVRKVLDGVNHTYSLMDACIDIEAEAPDSQDSGQTSNGRTHPTTQAINGITAHPLGGVVMGKACDYYGRVKGYDGLYVMDGAFIPGSTAATNPALTIAAFAERSIENIIANDL
jgi:cholesterol oxidase